MFHRPATIEDQIAAMQQQMGQLEKLMLALKNTGMDEASALLEAQQRAEDMRRLQAEDNPTSVLKDLKGVGEEMGDILGELEAPTEIPLAAPFGAATVGSACAGGGDPEQAMQGVLSLSSHLQPLISPSKGLRNAGASSLRRATEHQGPLSPTVLPALAMGLTTPQALSLAQAALLSSPQPNTSQAAPPPSALPGQAALLQRFDTVPLNLASHRPQTSVSIATEGTGRMIPYEALQWSGADAPQFQVAPQPAAAMLARLQGFRLPTPPSLLSTPAPPSSMLAGATGAADGLITMPIASLQQLLAISAGGGGNSISIGQHFSSGNNTSGSGGSGGGMNALLRNPSGANVVEGERALPQLSKWHSIKDLVEWLHKPHLVQSGYTIAEGMGVEKIWVERT